MSLPSFLVIGAMKAGTTSLHNYLSEHPDIFMSEDKELNFFNTSLNWCKGVDWYETQFDGAFRVRGESSPNYSKWEGTAERVHSIVPDVKLIYVLRNPVKRFVSQCNDKQTSPDKLVDELKEGKETEIFTNGLYHKWYLEYLKFYPKNKILLVTSEDLKQDKEKTLSAIFHFLDVDGIDYDFEKHKSAKVLHVTDRKKLASSSIQSMNNTNAFGAFKKVGAPLKPFLEPIWNRIFYNKNYIRELGPENKTYLKSRYATSLQLLTEVSGITFYESNT